MIDTEIERLPRRGKGKEEHSHGRCTLCLTASEHLAHLFPSKHGRRTRQRGESKAAETQSDRERARLSEPRSLRRLAPAVSARNHFIVQRSRRLTAL
jgi:hypothetical protein